MCLHVFPGKSLILVYYGQIVIWICGNWILILFWSIPLQIFFCWYIRTIAYIIYLHNYWWFLPQVIIISIKDFIQAVFMIFMCWGIRANVLELAGWILNLSEFSVSLNIANDNFTCMALIFVRIWLQEFNNWFTKETNNQFKV